MTTTMRPESGKPFSRAWRLAMGLGRAPIPCRRSFHRQFRGKTKGWQSPTGEGRLMEQPQPRPQARQLVRKQGMARISAITLGVGAASVLGAVGIAVRLADSQPASTTVAAQQAPADQGTSTDQGTSNQGTSNQGTPNDQGTSKDQGTSSDQGNSNDQGTSDDDDDGGSQSRPRQATPPRQQVTRPRRSVTAPRRSVTAPRRSVNPPAQSNNPPHATSGGS
jgi:hypothetical protein